MWLVHFMVHDGWVELLSAVHCNNLRSDLQCDWSVGTTVFYTNNENMAQNCMITPSVVLEFGSSTL